MAFKKLVTEQEMMADREKRGRYLPGDRKLEKEGAVSLLACVPFPTSRPQGSAELEIRLKKTSVVYLRGISVGSKHFLIQTQGTVIDEFNKVHSLQEKVSLYSHNLVGLVKSHAGHLIRKHRGYY